MSDILKRLCVCRSAGGETFSNRWSVSRMLARRLNEDRCRNLLRYDCEESMRESKGSLPIRFIVASFQVQHVGIEEGWAVA